MLEFSQRGMRDEGADSADRIKLNIQIQKAESKASCLSFKRPIFNVAQLGTSETLHLLSSSMSYLVWDVATYNCKTNKFSCLYLKINIKK